MQRVPTRQRQSLPANGTTRQHSANGETSPVLIMARRIRAEQGVEQLKSFLIAMEPFVAPNELRTISNDFGMSYDSLPRPPKQQNTPYNNPTMNMNPMQGRSNQNQFQMMQMLMNMQGMMKGGGDISQIFKMMGGR